MEADINAIVLKYENCSRRCFQNKFGLFCEKKIKTKPRQNSVFSHFHWVLVIKNRIFHNNTVHVRYVYNFIWNISLNLFLKLKTTFLSSLLLRSYEIWSKIFRVTRNICKRNTKRCLQIFCEVKTSKKWHLFLR